MKRLLIHLSTIVMIFVFSITSSSVAPAYGLGHITDVPVSLPTGFDAGVLTGISGTSDSNISAVGYGYSTPPVGQAPQFRPLFYAKNGDSWNASSPALPLHFDDLGMDYQEADAAVLQAIWASDHDSTANFVVGYAQFSGNNRPWLALTLNGYNWNYYDPDLPGTDDGALFGVWGLLLGDGEHVYAVGEGRAGTGKVPLLYEFSGWMWTAGTIPLAWSDGSLKDVWGTGSDLYAVGWGKDGGEDLPLILHGHYGSGAWSWDEPVPDLLPAGWVTGSLEAVWGSGPNDIYAVGTGGTSPGETLPLLLHYQDGTWSKSSPSLPSGWSGAQLHSVWGVDADEVYLAGAGQDNIPLLYRKAEDRWDASYSVPGRLSAQYTDIWGFGSDNLYAVGGGLDMPMLAHAGLDAAPPGDVIELNAVPGASAGEVSLSWTAPADDADENSSGPVTSYLVRYSTSEISSEIDWDNAAIVSSGLPTPTEPGTAESMLVTGLQPGTLYYFAIRAQDEQPNQSVNFVATNAHAALKGIYDDADPLWDYSPGWAGKAGKMGPLDDTFHATSTEGSTATFRFYGPALFSLYYRMGPNRGSFEIWMDGERFKTLNAYSATTVWQKKYTSPAFTTAGEHVMEIRNTSPTGTYIDVDAIDITPVPTPAGAGMYDDSNLHWLYSAGWIAKTNKTGPSDGTFHLTGTKGATATFVFQAPGQFVLYYGKAPNRGTFTVWVDGVKIATINAYRSTILWKKTYTSPLYLDDKAHTVMIQSSSPVGKYIDIDAIEIR